MLATLERGLMTDEGTTEKVQTFCALCVSRCGAIATREKGVLTALEPDRSHPTGRAICIKGKAAPELVYHPQRLLYPLERTRPKGDPDPGWRRISWSEALTKTAARLREIASEHGPESVVFSAASPSTSAISDSADWIQRLRRAFGSPNLCASLELCGFGRFFATAYTYGAPVPGLYLPDLERAGVILFWGYNPSVSRLSHATLASAAVRRGAKLIVVDPRRAGLAHHADAWLRVRPGTDTALALAMTRVLIERGWFDREFVTSWTNAPFLLRSNGRLLRASDLAPDGRAEHFVAWSETDDRPIVCDPKSAPNGTGLALDGERRIVTRDGVERCRPVFQAIADSCRGFDARTVEEITGVPAADVEHAARLLFEARPAAYYAWSGIEQGTNVTQTARAVAQLYALTGSFDAPGGNVRFAGPSTNPIDGFELLAPEQRKKALGLGERPLGGSRWEFVTSDELYTAALESKPYPVRGLVGFGANLLLAQADGRRGREALRALDFYVHADLFMNPTAEQADIVLPVASCFETEALAVGFDVSPDAQSLLQLRPAVAARRGEVRSDVEIVFALAVHLGLGEHFWDGDVDAGLRHRLAPSGVSLATLRKEAAGVRLPLETRHRKFADQVDGGVVGFGTPSRTIELYSETMLAHGQPALPEFEEPRMSPRSRPDLAARFPLVLTCAKSTWYCETQHRALPGLRERAPDPKVELHPDTARSRDIAENDWVRIETPSGSVRARVTFNPSLDPAVVCGEHGFWQGCEEIGAPAYDAFSDEGANFNLLIRHRPGDPISGSVPLRSYLCEVARIDAR